MITKLQDVAEKAGVSLSATSLILNGKGRFSQEVRYRVHQAAKDLGYKKNIYASSVARKSFTYMAVLLYEDINYISQWAFIRQIFITMDNLLGKKGFFPVIIPIDFNLTSEKILEKIHSAGCGAVFSFHYTNEELFTNLKDQEIPLVIINNTDFQNQFHTVSTDDFQGAYEGASYLIGLGHESIAYIDYPRPNMPSIFSDRFVGFKKALDEKQIDFSKELHITVDLMNMDDIRSKIAPLVSSTARPSALYCHDDYLAAMIFPILNEFSLSVPEDISVIASGETLDYDMPFVPKITTMNFDHEAMGRMSADMMVRIIRGKEDSFQSIKVRQHLVDRGSCKIKTDS